MSSTYVAMFEELGLLDAVVGVDELDFIYSPALRERAEAGLITEIGGGNLVNVEAAIALDPDIIFSYGSGSSDYDAYPVLEQAGLIVALNGDYVEASPLGRSEWLKFIAAFFNAEEQANDLFSQIAEDYTALRDVVGAPEDRPTVMVNGLFGDTWYVAGGQSYIARLIADAGGDYLWADDPSTGGVPLSLEAVVERAQDADIWLNPNFWLSLADGFAEDERYAAFAPFESGNVFNNVAQITDLGGNNYYEAGTLHPERILADMIFIFHPELLPDHALNFYVRLR
jgi:iron complex transport system substrate-binding protein